MGKSPHVLVLLVTFSIGSIFLLRNSLEKENRLLAEEAASSWQSSLLESLGDQIQQMEQDKKKMGASLEALEAKSLNQLDLIKNQQEQLQNMMAEMNATQIQLLEKQKREIGTTLEALEANSLNQMDLIKKQEEKMQSMNAEFMAMQEEQKRLREIVPSKGSLQSKNDTDSGKIQRMLRNGDIKYIFGVSTGHAGTVTVHNMLEKEGCPWKHKGEFELKEPHFERKLALPRLAKINETDTCDYTRDALIPYLDKRRKGATWIDAGHKHNRGHILECLASILGPKILFVRIRRNRHAIAKSFDNEARTPCFTLTADEQKKLKKAADGKRQNPGVAYCPLETTTPVSLPVSPETWKKFTSYQQFLWMADELEMRFHRLQTTYPDSQYLEVTWSNSHELSKGLHEVRTQMGCSSNFTNAPNMNHHIKHGVGIKKNCSEFISQDLEYRRLAQYSNQQKDVLFHQHPQPVNIDECRETKEELGKIISASSKLQDWVYESTSDHISSTT